VAASIETWSDADLIESAQAGNGDAFTVLYDRYVDRVYRLVSFRLGRNPDAEDLTQQTFVNAWQGIGRYRIREVPFVAWLLKIAHNLCMSQLRSTHYSVELNEAIDPADEVALDDGMIRTEARQTVLRAVDRLRDEQHQAVWMRYIEDLSYSEIARLLGKSEANVRVIMHRALRKLRRYLES
jgi:RNA polymerase sigma-70 factor (ECF subfamily)